MDSGHDCVNHKCTLIKTKQILTDEYGKLDKKIDHVMCDYICCCDKKLNLLIGLDDFNNTCLTEVKVGMVIRGWVLKSPQPYFCMPLVHGKNCDECRMQKCEEFFGKDEKYCKVCISDFQID